MKRNVRWLVAAAMFSLVPQLAMASGGYSQTVGLANLLSTKLNASSTSSQSVSSKGTSNSVQQLPTKTLPTQTQTVVKEFTQPVIQPIQTIVQPVVNTVIQPVYSTVFAQPIYNAPTTLQPIYSGSSGFNLTSHNLMSGNPFLRGSSFNSGFPKQSSNFGFGSSSKVSGFSGNAFRGNFISGHQGSFFAGNRNSSFGGFKGFSGGNSHFFGSSNRFRFGGFSSGPISQNFSVGSRNSFAFGGAAFKSSDVGSVSINVGNDIVRLPGFSALGVPKKGQSLQEVFNYTATFQNNGITYTAEVSSRLTASFAAPSASPSSVHAL